MINNLAQASAGITFVQIARGDVDNVRKDLHVVLSGKCKAFPPNVKVENEEEFMTSNRLQAVRLNLYSEPVYDLLDSGAITNAISASLVENIKLEVIPMKRCVIVANGASNGVEGMVRNVPVSFRTKEWTSTKTQEMLLHATSSRATRAVR